MIEAKFLEFRGEGVLDSTVRIRVTKRPDTRPYHSGYKGLRVE